MTNTNTNTDAYACPSCGSTTLSVQVFTFHDVNQDLSKEVYLSPVCKERPEFDDDSTMRCSDCGALGKAYGFKTTSVKEKAFPVPNLDEATLSAETLERWSKVLLILSKYAGLAATATSVRSQGSVTSALRIEEEMNGLYEQLPEWARW